VSGAKRRLFDKNDVLNVTVTKLLKSKFDCKESVYQSDISFVELIDNIYNTQDTQKIDTSINPMLSEIAKFDDFHRKIVKFDVFCNNMKIHMT